MGGACLKRPGISSNYLSENDIREVTSEEAAGLVGLQSAGLWIPYRTAVGNPIHDPAGAPFGRLRRADVKDGGHKYHQRAGTEVHSYIPRNFQPAAAGAQLIVVEGEFKAIALTDPAAGATYPAVGLSGFWGFHRKRQDQEPLMFTPELASVSQQQAWSSIVYLGDTDTAINFDFSLAAIRLREMLPRTIELLVPTVPLNEPKGIDDVREVRGGKFSRWFDDLLADALKIDRQTACELAIARLKAVADSLAKATDLANLKKRLIKVAARISDPVGVEEVLRLCKSALKVGLGSLRDAVKIERELLAQSNASAAIDRIEGLVCSFYFTGQTFYRQKGSEYQSFSRPDDVRQVLAADGLSPAQIKVAYQRIVSEKHVRGAVTLAGHPAGVLETKAGRYLIRSGPRFIEPQQLGACSTISQLLFELLGRGVDPFFLQQFSTLLAYLRTSVQALKDPDLYHHGPLLVFVGPPGVGKNLVQDSIITPLLGGRSSDPGDYVTGVTKFSASAFAAEHLMLADPAVDDFQTKKAVQRINGLISNQGQSVSEKFGDERHLRPRYRVSLSINPGQLPLLKQFGKVLLAKTVLLKAHYPSFLPSEAAERRILRQRIESELPVFQAQLDAFVIPPDLLDGRFGVRPWQHPELLGLLNSRSDTARFEGLLLTYVQSLDKSEVVMSTVDWFGTLCQMAQPEDRDVLRDVRSVGKLMAGLLRFGDKVRVEKVNTGYDKSRNPVPGWRVMRAS